MASSAYQSTNSAAAGYIVHESFFRRSPHLLSFTAAAPSYDAQHVRLSRRDRRLRFAVKPLQRLAEGPVKYGTMVIRGKDSGQMELRLKG
jgi:hypothetical protein